MSEPHWTSGSEGRFSTILGSQGARGTSVSWGLLGHRAGLAMESATISPRFPPASQLDQVSISQPPVYWPLGICVLLRSDCGLWGWSKEDAVWHSECSWGRRGHGHMGECRLAAHGAVEPGEVLGALCVMRRKTVECGCQQWLPQSRTGGRYSASVSHRQLHRLTQASMSPLEN